MLTWFPNDLANVLTSSLAAVCKERGISPAEPSVSAGFSGADLISYTGRLLPRRRSGLPRPAEKDSGLFRLITCLVHALLHPIANNPGREAMAAESSKTTNDERSRIEREYREMPGLRLTYAQVGRLAGLDQASCEVLLRSLVDARILTQMKDGSFVRVEHVAAVKATVRRKASTHAA